MLKVIELFSGIGSQRKALDRLNILHEVVCVSDIDKYAHKSYEAVHGKTLNVGDITKVDSLPNADMWTYSFPCTDLSIAGTMKGMDKGTRSGLVWEVVRLLDSSHRPKILLMENVKNIVGARFRNGFEELCSELESRGYTNKWKVLNAKDYGIPQNRERVFMVSVLGGTDFEFPEPTKLEITLGTMLEKDVEDKFYLTDQAIEYMSRERNGKARWEYHKNDVDGIASCLTASMYKGVPYGVLTPRVIAMSKGIKGHECIRRIYDTEGLSPTINTCGGGNREPKIMDPKVRKLTPKECWRLMGFSDYDFDNAAKVNSNSQLYKQAGNSIVVDVLEAIFDNLFKTKEGKECISANTVEA